MLPEVGCKFWRRAVGSGCDVCNQIKSERTTCEKFGTKQSSSTTAFDTGKVRSSVHDQGIQYLPSDPARNSLLEQTVLPKPKQIPVQVGPTKGISVKAVQMRIPEKSVPYRQANSATPPLQVYQQPSRLKNGSGDISFAWDISPKARMEFHQHW